MVINHLLAGMILQVGRTLPIACTKDLSDSDDEERSVPTPKVDTKVAPEAFGWQPERVGITCTKKKIWMFLENRGTPKSSILIGLFIINHPFWGTIIFWKHPYRELEAEVCKKTSPVFLSYFFACFQAPRGALGG